MILLIDNYDSFTFNVDQYLSQLGAKVKVVRNDQIGLDGISRLKPEAIVISPGPGTPDESGITLEAIKHFSGKIPILGICLGHQSIGQVFGGRVIRAKRLMHGKLSTITHSGKGVFRKLPKTLQVTRYHSLVVERDSLPSVLEVTAETEDGVIMGLRHRRFLVEGVQFHPESFMTEHGLAMLQNFLDAARKGR